MRVCACMYVHASMCIYACACVTVPALMRIRALSKAISVSVMARARTHLTKPNIRPINSFSSSSEKQTPIKPLSMGHQTHHSLRGVGGKMSHLFLPLQHDLVFHGGGGGGGGILCNFCWINTITFASNHIIPQTAIKTKSGFFKMLQTILCMDIVSVEQTCLAPSMSVTSQQDLSFLPSSKAIRNITPCTFTSTYLDY